MSLIRVVSQNIRGLRDSKKRKEVFHYFNIKKFDIIMLQETHSNVEVERVWRAEWGNSIFYAHGTTAARGTCILIKNSCTHVIHNVSSDENGRYLILDITISSERYTLASIYAPNEDHPEFFQNFFVTLSSMENENILIGGDFNVPLNLSLDKKGGRLDHSHNKARNEKKIILLQYFVDWIISWPHLTCMEILKKWRSKLVISQTTLLF